METNSLQKSILYLEGVGPGRANLLEAELGIKTLGDLVNFFPNRYIDRTRFYKIAELTESGSDVQIIGQITGIQTLGTKRKQRLVATFTDATGMMELVWFRSTKWIAQNLKTGVDYVIYGRVNKFKNSFSMPHPEMELKEDFNKSLRTALEPVYSSTEKLTKKNVTNRVIQKLIQTLFLQFQNHFQETLSNEIMKQHRLVSKNEALFQIHFPESQDRLAKARLRLKFEELFFIQLQLLRKNILRKQKIKGYPFEKVGDFFNQFYKKYLPFELTGAQKRVLKEIRKDVNSSAQMNRLLQGDVGSGKTIVALMSALIALDNDYQVALMAPTEILAQQHYESTKRMLGDMPVKVALLTGSTRTLARKEIHQSLIEGDLHILIGTHALLEDKVKFKNLGLVIIDEQHRFGVAQRARMWKKNILPPHILVMTATPIPRTLAMSIYGDLDISVIDELPPGRKKIKTAWRFDKNRASVFQFIREEIKRGRQVYIVYPLIEESEVLDYKDLMDGYESIIRSFPKPDYQVSIVHGRMKPIDKDYEMQQFASGKTQILVATTVIEVGVDIPNASVMIIESAEKFGLSQLHQLRGRVGRGADQSYCILMTGQKLSDDAKVRLQTMVATTDGFEIAEVDLKLRGPGNLMGTQQSGVLSLKIADVVKDNALLKMARYTAIELIEKDPNLNLPENKNIRNTYQEIDKKVGVWANIS